MNLSPEQKAVLGLCGLLILVMFILALTAGDPW